MKVILEAFGGELKSAVMNWPDNVGPMIKMAMNIDGHRFVDFNGSVGVDEPSRPVIGTFESTGEHFLLKDGYAARYRLVDVS